MQRLKTCKGDKNMKLKDLIADLQKQNQDAEVIVATDNGAYSVGWMRLADGRIAIQTGFKTK